MTIFVQLLHDEARNCCRFTLSTLNPSSRVRALSRQDSHESEGEWTTAPLSSRASAPPPLRCSTRTYSNLPRIISLKRNLMEWEPTMAIHPPLAPCVGQHTIPCTSSSGSASHLLGSLVPTRAPCICQPVETLLFARLRALVRRCRLLVGPPPS